ncbi:MAG: hypothetical protein ACLUDH_13420 [Faecalispora sporosphaeroides]|uniref:hypothetical protein n=1 Tax=Faecalispora sporosphaeroides TaxID=1549 RepID=UPI0039915ED9
MRKIIVGMLLLSAVFTNGCSVQSERSNNTASTSSSGVVVVNPNSESPIDEESTDNHVESSKVDAFSSKPISSSIGNLESKTKTDSPKESNTSSQPSVSKSSNTSKAPVGSSKSAVTSSTSSSAISKKTSTSAESSASATNDLTVTKDGKRYLVFQNGIDYTDDITATGFDSLNDGVINQATRAFYSHGKKYLKDEANYIDMMSDSVDGFISKYSSLISYYEKNNIVIPKEIQDMYDVFVMIKNFNPTDMDTYHNLDRIYEDKNLYNLFSQGSKEIIDSAYSKEQVIWGVG